MLLHEGNPALSLSLCFLFVTRGMQESEEEMARLHKNRDKVRMYFKILLKSKIQKWVKGTVHQISRNHQKQADQYCRLNDHCHTAPHLSFDNTPI